jgi:hypothetical protein
MNICTQTSGSAINSKCAYKLPRQCSTGRFASKSGKFQQLTARDTNQLDTKRR